MADDHGSVRSSWRYSNEITLGHIIQAITLVIMIGGGAITSYVSLRSDIQTLREQSAVDIAKLNSELLRQLAIISSRVLTLEVSRTADQAYQVEIRQKVDRLIDAMADLRVQVGKRSEGNHATDGAAMMPRSGL